MKNSNESRTQAETRACGQSGFTLVEILLVVVIIGILAAVAVPRFAGKTKAAAIAATRSSIAAIGTAIDAYEVENGAYPSSLQDLITRPANAMNWHGPYLRDSRAAPQDNWGTPFQYAPREDGYEIRSAGPNAVMGDTDDITN